MVLCVNNQWQNFFANLLNGRVWSLGNPSPDKVQEALAMTDTAA
ncbi:MAG: hypothetical protein R3E79_56890 [Caldilineaceae bacterium]